MSVTVQDCDLAGGRGTLIWFFSITAASPFSSMHNLSTCIWKSPRRIILNGPKDLRLNTSRFGASRVRDSHFFVPHAVKRSKWNDLKLHYPSNYASEINFVVENAPIIYEPYRLSVCHAPMTYARKSHLCIFVKQLMSTCDDAIWSSRNKLKVTVFDRVAQVEIMILDLQEHQKWKIWAVCEVKVLIVP